MLFALPLAQTQAEAPSGEASPPAEAGVPATADDRPEGEDGPSSEALAPAPEPALTGLLVDRTITMIGKTFFQKFSQLRLDSAILSNASLAIHERPSARWGSIVWVSEGTRILYEATLPPRLSEVDQYAEAAVGQVEQLILRRKVTEALQDNHDLADDEF
ncbi:CsgE family curli-type amyloid fiber assembly protein [Modicisalibacter ilicicola]|uniref:CsgE family curli-type amyloid fiber assembly protein n=1 Tax=Modicisalibacter ilicicola TaxID=480814 RepID=UPI0009FC5FEB|nr:CsgE family curli-type amyloid fiber assembly protein [Halomonas ilicicola]